MQPRRNFISGQSSGQQSYKSPNYYQQTGPKIKINEKRYEGYQNPPGQKQYHGHATPVSNQQCQSSQSGQCQYCMRWWMTCMNFISSSIICFNLCQRCIH